MILTAFKQSALPCTGWAVAKNLHTSGTSMKPFHTLGVIFFLDVCGGLAAGSGGVCMDEWGDCTVELGSCLGEYKELAESWLLRLWSSRLFSRFSAIILSSFSYSLISFSKSFNSVFTTCQVDVWNYYYYLLTNVQSPNSDWIITRLRLLISVVETHFINSSWAFLSIGFNLLPLLHIFWFMDDVWHSDSLTLPLQLGICGCCLLTCTYLTVGIKQVSVMLWRSVSVTHNTG